MTNRRTSIYTLTVPSADDDLLDRLAEHLPPISDRQDTGVSFRAGSDESAIGHATRALSAEAPEAAADLYTGLGMHRRHVATEPGQ